LLAYIFGHFLKAERKRWALSSCTSHEKH